MPAGEEELIELVPASSWQLQTSVLFKTGTEAGLSWQTGDERSNTQLAGWSAGESVPVPGRPPILLSL